MEWTFDNISGDFGIKDIPADFAFVSLRNMQIQYNKHTSGGNIVFSGEFLSFPPIEGAQEFYDENIRALIKENKLPVYMWAYTNYTTALVIYVDKGEVVAKCVDSSDLPLTIDLTTPLNGFMGDSRVTTAHLPPPILDLICWVRKVVGR